MIENIFVIGAGGTGSFLIPALARFLFSQNFNGVLTIIDGDKYEEKNADRQLFSKAMLNTNKAEYQCMAIESQLPNVPFELEYIDEYLSEEDVKTTIPNGSVVINCADNHAIRKYVEDHIQSLEHGIHICCGNEFRDGQVQVSGLSELPSIYEKYPEMNTTDGDISTMSCQEISALPSGGQLIAANMMAAAIGLNYFIRVFDGKVPWTHCVEYDVLNNNFLSHKLEICV